MHHSSLCGCSSGLFLREVLDCFHPALTTAETMTTTEEEHMMDSGWNSAVLQSYEAYSSTATGTLIDTHAVGSGYGGTEQICVSDNYLRLECTGGYYESKASFNLTTPTASTTSTVSAPPTERCTTSHPIAPKSFALP